MWLANMQICCGSDLAVVRTPLSGEHGLHGVMFGDEFFGRDEKQRRGCWRLLTQPQDACSRRRQEQLLSTAWVKGVRI